MQRTKAVTIFAAGLVFLTACGSPKPTDEPTRPAPTALPATKVVEATKALPTATATTPPATPTAELTATKTTTPPENAKPAEWHEVKPMEGLTRTLELFQRMGITVTPQFTATAKDGGYVGSWLVQPKDGRTFDDRPADRQIAVDTWSKIRATAPEGWTPFGNVDGVNGKPLYDKDPPAHVDIIGSGVAVIPVDWKRNLEKWEKVPGAIYFADAQDKRDADKLLVKVGEKKLPDGSIVDQYMAYIIWDDASLDYTGQTGLRRVTLQMNFFDRNTTNKGWQKLSKSEKDTFLAVGNKEATLPIYPNLKK